MTNQYLDEAIALLREWGEPYTKADESRAPFGYRIREFLERYDARDAAEPRAEYVEHFECEACHYAVKVTSEQPFKIVQCAMCGHQLSENREAPR